MSSQNPNVLDGYILISNNDSWTDLFHKKTVFKTLTDEHFLKILFLQKIKIKANNFTRVYIILDDLEEDFNLKTKLLHIAKYSSESFGIFLKILNL